MSDLRLREDLSAIPDYKPGKTTTQSAPTGPVFKVSSNENPYPPLPSVASAIADRITHINRYPRPRPPPSSRSCASDSRSRP